VAGDGSDAPVVPVVPGLDVPLVPLGPLRGAAVAGVHVAEIIFRLLTVIRGSAGRPGVAPAAGVNIPVISTLWPACALTFVPPLSCTFCPTMLAPAVAAVPAPALGWSPDGISVTLRTHCSGALPFSTHPMNEVVLAAPRISAGFCVDGSAGF
jgi:hypothetical protein